MIAHPARQRRAKAAAKQAAARKRKKEAKLAADRDAWASRRKGDLPEFEVVMRGRPGRSKAKP